MMKRLPVFLTLLLLVSCTGDFDQRVVVARTVGSGAEQIGSSTNPAAGVFVTGNVSIGGKVRGVAVTLRPVRLDGQIDFDNANVLGVSIGLENGAYQVNLRDANYRGAIVVEVRGQDVQGGQTTGANPATAVSAPTHAMSGDHVLYSVVPVFEGKNVFDAHVTPLTTFAVMRGLFYGGVSAGMFGVTASQTADFFGLPRVRQGLPTDFAGTGTIGQDFTYGLALTALSQVAKNLGVENVFDFYLGLALDGRDDGIANGSIGPIPNTGIAMPNLGAANLLGNALLNDYLAPLNADRLAWFDSSAATPGSLLQTLAATLNQSRNIDNFSYEYSLVVNVPAVVNLVPGQEYRSRILTLAQVDPPIGLECYGDSAGPGFVAFDMVSSSPANVTVLPSGRIVAGAGAAVGSYSVSLTVHPAIGQSFVTGPTRNFTIIVNVN